MAEAEKYLGTQSTHTNQSTQPKTPPKKNYSFSILLFILGIVAVIVLAVFTSMRKLPSIVLISELIVLASLIGLLLVSISAKRRMVRQFALNERYPYANVEKKEIEAIFDKIAEEEKKRRKLDAFASGVDLSKMPTITSPKAQPETDDSGSEDQAEEKAKNGSTGEEESDIIAVFPDEDESSGKDKASGDESSEEKDSDKSDESAKDGGDDKKEKHPASKRPEGDGERPRKKRPPEGERQRPRKQRPYDPYYEDYYYDSNGKRHRAPVYYDEYGNPIRPRVVYDEYGNPIRRRPADPRRAPAGKHRRPPEGSAQKRPASHSNASGSHTGKKKRRAPSGPVAPVEMTPIKQHSNYGDDYVPVAIVDEEEEYVPAPRAKQPPKKHRPANAAEAAEAAKKNPYVPEYDDDIVAVLDYDDEDTDNRDYTPASKAREQRLDNSSDNKRKPATEKYVPDYSDEEAVIALPDYDDDDETPAKPYQRQQAAASAASYDDEDEDEPLVVLPRDEGYEEYMESKQSAARKAERKAKGQTALTIRKLRHKKIRRKSRKYKIFRASVHTLTEYLNSFAVKSRR